MQSRKDFQKFRGGAVLLNIYYSQPKFGKEAHSDIKSALKGSRRNLFKSVFLHNALMPVMQEIVILIDFC